MGDLLHMLQYHSKMRKRRKICNRKECYGFSESLIDTVELTVWCFVQDLRKLWYLVLFATMLTAFMCSSSERAFAEI